MTDDEAIAYFAKLRQEEFDKTINKVIENLSTEWITYRKPIEDGIYMVTLDAFGQHRFIKLMNYGKPLMPNRKVKGRCWYRSSDEYGDVVYDDDDILAWLPLPKPYGEREEG